MPRQAQRKDVQEPRNTCTMACSHSTVLLREVAEVRGLGFVDM